MSYSSVFDLFKIGIGPSSSHTMGPMSAAARFAAGLEETEVTSITVELHGSLALTGIGHGTDKAIVAGLAGHQPATIPIEVMAALSPIAEPIVALAGGRSAALTIERIKAIHPLHPNVVRFVAAGADGTILSDRTFASIGGGFISEAGQDVRPSQLAPFPLDYRSAEELLRLCRSERRTIAEIALTNELTRRSGDQVRAELKTIVAAMYESIDRGMRTTGKLPGSLNVRRRARDLGLDLAEHSAIRTLPPTMPSDWAGVYATAVNEENAAGGRIVTAPTNGAAGIVPAVLRFMKEFCQPVVPEPEQAFLLTAGAIGSLLKANAGISGAELGCQGEVGSACAMAAAGLTAALGGSPEQVENAAEIAIEHNLGLTCDPVGGLVQVPCIERNAIGAVKAIAACSLALRGTGEHIVSFDAVIETLRQTGHDMDSKYKETSLGGLAVNVPAC
jgi:L-serine dehydratase